MEYENYFEEQRQKRIERKMKIKIWAEETDRRIASGNPEFCNHSGFDLRPFGNQI